MTAQLKKETGQIVKKNLLLVSSGKS